VKEFIVTTMIRFCAAALVLVMAVPVWAQENRPAQTPLKIQLVLSRFQGDKKLSSVPYLLWITAPVAGSRPEQTNLRMGVKIPVMTGSAANSYNYQDVGTNIDCWAFSNGDGTYKVSLTVADSSIYFKDKDDPRPGIGTMNTAIPAFRSFTSNFSILLRDNQTAQYTTATDQVSGEVLKIDATLNVLK
jgi:hypothetical protein